MNFQKLRQRAIKADAQRAIEFAGPARQRYTCLPVGVKLFATRSEALTAAREWMDNFPDSRLVGGSHGYTVHFHYYERRVDMRIPSKNYTEFFMMR